MEKDQVIINDGANGGASTTSSTGSFSIGSDGSNDVKKVKISTDTTDK